METQKRALKLGEGATASGLRPSRLSDPLVALHEIAVAASGLRDPSVLTGLVVDRARDLLNADAAALYWWDAEEGTLRTIAHNDPGEPAPEPPFKPGEGAAGQAFRDGRPVRVNDYKAWTDAIAGSVARGVVSGLAVPLLVSQQAVGALGVWTRDRRSWSSQDERLLTLFAAQSAPALEAARLAVETNRQANMFRALHQVAVAAGGLRDIAELGELVVDRTRQLLGCDLATLCWFDRERLRVLATTTLQPDVRGDEVTRPSALLEAYERREPVLLEDYADSEMATAPALGAGIRSVVAVPVMARDSALGSLAVGFAKPHHFSREDIQLLSLLALQIGPALENAGLLTESERRRDHFETLAGRLSVSEERMRELYQTVACGVLVQDAKGLIIEGNRQAEEILGWSLEEMRGKPSDEIWEAISPDGRPLNGSQRPTEAALRAGKPAHGVVIGIRTRAGELRWLQVDAIPVKGGARRERRIISSFIDITQRKRAEEGLLANQRKLRAIFDHAPIGLCQIDFEGHIQESNRVLQAMLGRSARELGELSLVGLLGMGTDQRGLLDEFASGRRDGYTAERRVLRRDGGEMWASISLELVRGSAGEPLYLIGMVEDVSARRAQTELLEYQAMHDGLTDLPNRTLLNDRLQQAILTAQRENRRLALLLLDLNRFKDVNDSFGHQLGDVLLQQVGPRIMAQLRESDTVARLGGDEFAVVLPAADDVEGAIHAARRILRALQNPFVIDDRKLKVGASIGIAMTPEHGLDPAGLMRKADTAMYSAKRARSGFAVYSTELDQASRGRLALLDELREAIETGQLVLHYQPKLRMRDSSVVGVEALIRWEHPRHGLMSPDQFIELAEETGLVVPLSYWSLGRALAQSRAWSGRMAGLPVSVNLSVQNLRDPRLTGMIANELERSGAEPGSLTLEIEETALMADPSGSARVLTALRELGVRTSIDNFGIGYASLDYLRELAIDELKIDRSFVLSIGAGTEEVGVIHSAVELGHSLGLEVVAEGAETEAATEILRAGGCDVVQGYYVSRPLPPRQLMRWFAARSWAQQPEMV